jgi:hypothetical protein
MPKGSSGIPALRLETLNKLITKIARPPATFFTGLFPSARYDSDTIKWEIEYNSAGMTPFVAPGSVAPAIGTDGIGEGSAKCAFMKEKMYFDETFLNNLRLPGTHATYQTAQRHLARGTAKLKARLDRRREWMTAKMLLDGALSYSQEGGTKFSVSYGVPTNHIVTLPGNRKWDGVAADRNPIEDIYDAKTVLADDAGVSPDYSICNTEVIKSLILDTDIQALLQKSAFGQGDLFANPAQVLGTLLGLGTLMVYDELYEVETVLTASVGATDTTINVADASDLEAGGKLRLYDLTKYNTYEDVDIVSVDIDAGTVETSAVVGNYIVGRCKVVMRKKFIDDDTFFMFSSTDANGEKIAEVMEAPYGVNRRWGMFADTKDEWDPEGVWLRIQDKALPVLYHPDTSYKLIVK